MDVLIPCDPGAAAACARETERYLQIIETGNSYVIASGTQEEISTAIWHAHTALDYLLVLARDVAPQNLKQDLWAEGKQLFGETFAVKCRGFEKNHEENEEWGGAFKTITNIVVDLEKPQTIITPFFTGSEVILGVSLTNSDLRKRDYRVFTSNMSLRPTIAAAALRFAGFTGKEKLLIPYEDDGTVTIEAALMATGKSPFYYSGLSVQKTWKTDPPEANAARIDTVVPSVQFLKAVQKNAKIAGVHKSVYVTKADLDWLDTKYDEHAFDLLVAHLPSSGKRRTTKDSQKIAGELAYQAAYVLKKNGTITIITLKPDEHSPSFEKYKELGRHELSMGEQKIWVITYGL